MEYNEYLVTVKTSEGEKARIVVHTGSDADARRMAEQAHRDAGRRGEAGVVMPTCKHCGQPIDRDITTYWVHTATKRVMCEDRKHGAEAS